MRCFICNKKIKGIVFRLEISIKKQILTTSGYGRLKDYSSISGHYKCIKTLFNDINKYRGM